MALKVYYKEQPDILAKYVKIATFSVAWQDIGPNDSINDSINASGTLRFCEILTFCEVLTCFERKY